MCKLISSFTLAAVFCKWLCSLKFSIRRWNYTCQFSESDCAVQGPQELLSHVNEKAWTIWIAYRMLCILMCIRGRWAYEWPSSGRTIDAEADSIWAINGFGLIFVKQIWAAILTQKIFYCCLRRCHWRIVPSHTSHGCCGHGSTTKSRCCCCNVRFSTTIVHHESSIALTSTAKPNMINIPPDRYGLGFLLEQPEGWAARRILNKLSRCNREKEE